MADLVVERDILFRGVDRDVVAQAVEQLRPVGLRVDRLEPRPLDIGAALGPVGLGVDVDAVGRAPFAGEAGERAEVGERVGVDVLGSVKMSSGNVSMARH